jgi:pimeloyl-ACP methyl ester carboxylesterase
VLLHGLASNSTRWWDFVARTRLKDWKILRPDLRGHAGSSDRGRIGMREWCDDLARLLDAEGSERAVIAGHCMGANIALNFCARHPQRTSGLALIEPMPPKALAGSLRRLAWFRFLLKIVANIVRANITCNDVAHIEVNVPEIHAVMIKEGMTTLKP